MATLRKDKSLDYKQPVIEDSDKDLIAKCQTLYKNYHDSTFKYRRQWYLNDNFYDGKHFVWWRKSTGTIDRIQPPKGAVLRSIPKASRQLDSIQNLIIANDPKWTVYPEREAEGIISPEAEVIAKRSRQWLEERWDHLNMSSLAADLVHYALKFPFAFFEIGFDKDISVSVWDAFDILFQPDVFSIYDSPVVIKQLQKNVEDIRNNSNYNENRLSVKPTSKMSGDEMKDLRLTEKFGYIRGKEKEDTCNLQEFYFKEFQDDGSKKIRIVTLADDNYLLRNELTDLNEYPFVCYSAKSGPLYQPAWIERMMPANKSLDLIVSNIENFFNLMTKGYWIKHKNANVTRIVNENGAFIEWDVQPPTQARLESIPNYVFAHLANLEKWIEEQSTSSVSIGRIPRGIKAYKAIESLKQSDFAGLKVSILRLEEAIEKTAEIMLDLADKFYDSPKTVYQFDGEKPDYFDVVGGKSYDQMYEEQRQGKIPLRGNFKVDVQIESGLAYTEEGKRQTMMELYSMGLMPAEKVLDIFKFSNIGELIASAQAEKQVSMIDTQDFQALSPETQKTVLQELLTKNVTLPQAPQPEKMQFRSRERPKGGEKNAAK